MNHTWLGVFAGFVLLGIWVLMGLTIFHGKDLVMQRENWELARILVPSMISIIGWLVTIWWALRQIEISSDKNRQLQCEMLQSNEKIKVIDATILAYMEINKALHKIRYIIVNLKINIESKVQRKNNPDLSQIFNDSGNAYSELFVCIENLQFNLIRLTPHGISLEKGSNFIHEIHKYFSNQSPWLTYQEQATAYFQDESIGYENFFSVIDTVASNCEKLCGDAFEAVADMNNSNKAN
ncbi:MAG: hypothetical protein IT525_13235 [Nitrosomonas sp.]|nr:hypothetical protein [Nitrosomonas sp.]